MRKKKEAARVDRLFFIFENADQELNFSITSLETPVKENPPS